MSVGRVASLVLVSPQGELLGMLPPLELACPYWPESADVVAAVAEHFHARVVMLRLLSAESSRASGGTVAYLAELSSGTPSVELLRVPAELRERALGRDEKRMPWAELGGPAQSLNWARTALSRKGQSSLTATQQRTWNLSTLWRLETATAPDSTIWLKQVPHFMKHESSVLAWLNRAAPGTAPTLLVADDSGRSLLAHVQGDDLYGASVATRHLILEQLHVIQRAGAKAVGELVALGAPDLRGLRRGADMRRKLVAWSVDYPGLEAILLRLDEQLERLEECALPATLVHADNHPGNARGAPEGVVLLDWGEAFVGNPVTDVLGLIGGLSPAEAAPLLEHWCASWRSVAPGSNPERALEIGPFIAALHGAATFAHFLQQIEETEWPYHSTDVPRCLKIAEALCAGM